MFTAEETRDELKRVYLWATRHHKMVAAHAALVRLHDLAGGYCEWERRDHESSGGHWA